MRALALFVALAALFILPACHTMRFELDRANHDRRVYERKSFFLWGLAPTCRVDVGRRCPYGAAAISERTTFTDGLLGVATLGIWSPRSTWYYCLPNPRHLP